MEDDGHLLQDITAAEEHARESTEYESSIRLLSNVGSAYLNTWIGAQLSLPLKLLRVLNWWGLGIDSRQNEKNELLAEHFDKFFVFLSGLK